MKQLVLALAILISPLSFALAMSDDEPRIDRGVPPASDIVYYGHDLTHEAWEVVADRADETFLNYSRFPYGDVFYRGQPTQVCFAIVKGVGGKIQKFVGASENADHLAKALSLVVYDRTSRTPIYACKSMHDLLVTDPRYRDLEFLFKSI
jgi:hypothetical protein